MANEKLVNVENLVKYFPVTAGVFSRKVADVKAVDDVSFFIEKGETAHFGERPEGMEPKTALQEMKEGRFDEHFE